MASWASCSLRVFRSAADRPGSVLFLSPFIFPAPFTQPGGFFLGFCRAERVLTGEPFNPIFFGTAGIAGETSSPSQLEAPLKVKRNNAHGWGFRFGSP